MNAHRVLLLSHDFSLLLIDRPSRARRARVFGDLDCNMSSSNRFVGQSIDRSIDRGGNEGTNSHACARDFREIERIPRAVAAPN